MHKTNREIPGEIGGCLWNLPWLIGELDKKYRVFYEKLLAKCTNYAIINFDRRKPSKKCPKSKAKDRAIQYNRSFSADTRAFTQKRTNAAQGRSIESPSARVQVGRPAGRWIKRGILNFERCRFQARRHMGNVKYAEMQTNQVKENWHAID